MFFVEEYTKSRELTTTAEPTKSTGEKSIEKMEEITEKIAEEMGIPTWGVVTIIVSK